MESSTPVDMSPRTSLARQRRPHISPYATPVVEAAGPSQTPPRSELALDESARAYRTTALRQLNGNPRPLSRRPRQGTAAGNRSSTLASQPVLVRSYSGHSDRVAENSKMPSRQPGSSSERPRPAELPSAEDFSIESILRAIDPEIHNTLDSIAEICGRSRLSLANEYGHHIAPLGEIRAPPGGLLTVEEASASHEGEPDDNVVIYDDDNSVMDERDRDPAHPSYLENIRRVTTGNAGNRAMPLSSREMPSMQEHSGPRRSDKNRAPGISPELYSFPVIKEVSSSPGSWALLGRTVESVDPHQSIQTTAVVSEVHLDARANRPSPPGQRRSSPDQTGEDTTPVTRHGPPSQPILQTFFTWLRQIPRGEPAVRESAEMRLRETLERQASQNVPAV